MLVLILDKSHFDETWDMCLASVPNVTYNISEIKVKVQSLFF